MPFQLPSRQTIFLYTIACFVNLYPFFVTVAFTWTSPTIPRLNGNKDPDNNPLGRPITTAEISLLGSIFTIGAMFGPFATLLIIPKFGRKIGIMFFTILIMVCFLMYAFATRIEVYYVARFIGGLSGGAVFVLVPIYLAEIASDNQRGRLGSLAGLFGACGGLYTYLVGTFLSIKWFALSGLIGPIVLLSACLTFIPETPFYWILRKNDEEAEKVLVQIRSGINVKKEISKIKVFIQNLNENDKAELVDLVRTRGVRKCMVFLICLEILKQFSGVFVIQLYLESIFREANTPIPPEYSVILIGCFRVLSVAIPLTIIECSGRRVLLMQSCIGIFISNACLGTYFYLNKQDYNLSDVNWIPIVCIIMFVISFNSGFGVVLYVLMGELFPQKLKYLANMIIITVASILATTVIFIFPLLVEAIGMEYCFWMFSIAGILAAIVTYLFLPETKGKTLLEIQKILEK